MHLLNLVVELSPLEHLKGVAINVEHSIRLNLSVSALHERLFGEGSLPLSMLLLIKTIDFLLPFLLNDLYDVALIFGLEDGEFNLDGAFFVDQDVIFGC